MIETNRLLITKLNINMAYDIHVNSLDEDTKKYIPDEVFESVDVAKDAIEYLISRYDSKSGPFVYPIIIKDTNENIGYVELVKMDNDEYEIGYHIAKRYTNNGYAKEALKAFLPYISNKLNINKIVGICLSENIASKKVLLDSGFLKMYEGIGLYQGQTKTIFKSIWSK